MKTFIAFLLWCILLVLCWPLAFVIILLYPIIWLLLIPFRIIGFSMEVIFELIKAILLFPFRVFRTS